MTRIPLGAGDLGANPGRILFEFDASHGDHAVRILDYDLGAATYQLIHSRFSDLDRLGAIMGSPGMRLFESGFYVVEGITPRKPDEFPVGESGWIASGVRKATFRECYRQKLDPVRAPKAEWNWSFRIAAWFILLGIAFTFGFLHPLYVILSR